MNSVPPFIPAIPAVILAAGQGTRMRSGLAKVLHPVCGVPMVIRAVRALRLAGCSPVVVVVGHQGEEVEKELARLGDEQVTVAWQREQKGTGHAVMAARGAWSEGTGAFVVIPGDMPLLEADTVLSLLEAHHHSSAALTFLTFELEEPGVYGRVLRGGDGRVQRIVEWKDATPSERAVKELNSGVYAMDREFVFGKNGALARLHPDNAAGEYYLTDLVACALEEGRRVEARIHPSSHELVGVNDRAQLVAAEASLFLRTARRHLLAGVTVRTPEGSWIHPEVSLAADVILEPGVRLLGNTTVSSGAEIGPFATLIDCHIGEGVRVGQGCILEKVTVASGARLLPYTVASGVNEKRPASSSASDRVEIGESARVGPFSHLRPASRLGEEVHIGNFVEVKAVSLKKGAKANHLAYLGDGEVGAGANIGAGVIFCNYDGFDKHRTIVEEGAFIGSDSQLVAPVRVGRGAYVGSGSTITRDVPDGSLSVGRARQVDLPGRADRIRERRAEKKAAAAREGGEEPSGENP